MISETSRNPVWMALQKNHQWWSRHQYFTRHKPILVKVAENHSFTCQSSCINGTSYNTFATIIKRWNDLDLTCKKSPQDRIFQISSKTFRIIAHKCASEVVKGLSKIRSKDFYICLILYNFHLWNQRPKLLCDAALTLAKVLVATAQTI